MSESNDGSDGGHSSGRREAHHDGGSSSNTTNSKKRKKNATMACNTCRRKRNRCILEEGERVCRGCKASGTECHFAEFDRRRDGIQELREKLSFYESMFETLKGGGGGGGSTSHPSGPTTAPPPPSSSSAHDHAAALNSAHDSTLTNHHHHHHEGSFDFLSNGFPTSSSTLSNGTASASASAASTSFFDNQQLSSSSNTSDSTALSTVTPQSSVRSKRPRESPREENGSAVLPPPTENHQAPHARTHAQSQSQSQGSNNNLNGSSSTRPPQQQQTPQSNGPHSTNPAYDDQHQQRESSRVSDTSGAHRRISGRTPDMSAVMDHLAVESDGLIRAYGATSSTALAGFEDLQHSQKAVYSTRRYQSAFNSKDPPREVTPPADVQPLQTSPLVAAAANIAALPLGTDIRTVQHLLHLYFLWAWPMFPVISRQIFMQHFSNGGQYYSPLLLNVSA